MESPILTADEIRGFYLMDRVDSAIMDAGYGLDYSEDLWDSRRSNYGRSIAQWSRDFEADGVNTETGSWLLMTSKGYRIATREFKGARFVLAIPDRPHGRTKITRLQKIVSKSENVMRFWITAKPKEIAEPTRFDGAKATGPKHLQAVTRCPWNGCASVALSSVTGIRVDEWLEVAMLHSHESGVRSRTGSLYNPYALYRSLGCERIKVAGLRCDAGKIPP